MSISCGSVKAPPSASASPCTVVNGEASPGVKRGGTVNIVTHTIDLECSVDNIPQYIEADVGALEISHSLHLSEIKLPAGVKSLSREDATLVTIVPPSGYAEEQKAAAAAAAAGTAAPAAGAAAAPAAAAPAAGAAGSGGWRESAGWWRQEEVNSGRMPRHAPVCRSR
jgi:large subunit ribosomal protein L25